MKDDNIKGEETNKLLIFCLTKLGLHVKGEEERKKRRKNKKKEKSKNV